MRRFPITAVTTPEENKTMEGIKRWNSLTGYERTKVVDIIDRKVRDDEEDWSRKRTRAKKKA